jgi:hypothetical protein
MFWLRMLKHFAAPAWLSRRLFRSADVTAIAAAVKAAESAHRGELRFVAEGPLALGHLWHGISPRQRALELFGALRVWDTAENNGVLVYVQLVDRKVEILADRAISAKVSQVEWDSVCREAEGAFAAKAYRRGALDVIDHIARLLSIHFPSRGHHRANELPDLPLLL